MRALPAYKHPPLLLTPTEVPRGAGSADRVERGADGERVRGGGLRRPHVRPAGLRHGAHVVPSAGTAVSTLRYTCSHMAKKGTLAESRMRTGGFRLTTAGGVPA